MTPTWNDGHARVRHLLGSGWPSQITYCALSSHKTSAWPSPLSSSVRSSFLFSSLRPVHQKGERHIYHGNNAPPPPPPKSLWLKAFCAAFHRLMARLEKTILNMKVRRSYQPPKPWTFVRRTRQKKHRRASLAQVTNMTSTWFNPGAATRPSARQFDSDSHDLMLDDGASACITNCEDDFVEPPKRVNRKVKGIKGHADATHRGTIKWYLEDDAGLVHVLIIRGAYLIPDAATRILSPQHLAQQAKDHYPKEEGTGSLTTSKAITLFWSQRRFTKTVPLDPRTNVGLTTTATGTRSFRAFCAPLNVEETKETNIFTTHVIPDEEDDESFQPRDPVAPPEAEADEPAASPEQSHETPSPGPSSTLADIGPISHVIPEDEEPTSLNLHDELLRWHYRMGHLPFDRIKHLAQT